MQALDYFGRYVAFSDAELPVRIDLCRPMASALALADSFNEVGRSTVNLGGLDVIDDVQRDTTSILQAHALSIG